MNIMSQIYSIAKEKRRNVFLDTKKVYETDDLLINAIQYSISKQKIILESDVVEIINTQKQLIEPAMIVVVGLLAGTVVISIFLPMFSMTDSLEV